MSAPRLRISELAAELGLGVATVSNALNGKGRVAAATRDRVLEHAQARGYQPNAVARSLRVGAPGALELHLPQQAKHLSFYMDFAFGVVDVASEAGRDVILSTADHPRGNGPVGVDGAVFIDCDPASERLAELSAAGVPTVLGDGFPGTPPAGASVVFADHAAAMTRFLDAACAAGTTKALLVEPDTSFSCAWQEGLRPNFMDYVHQHDLIGTSMEFPVTAPDGELIGALRDVLHPERSELGFVPDMLLFGGQRWAGVACAELGLGRPGSAVPWVASLAGDPASEIDSPVLAAHDLQARAFGRRCGEVLLGLVDGTVDPATRPGEIWNSTITWPEHWGE